MRIQFFAHLPAIPARLARPVLAGVFAVGLVSALDASAIWESTDWALQSGIDTRLTYDSNVSGGPDGDADTYISARPSLSLLRHGSLTKLRVDAAVNIRRFMDFTDENSEDPQVTISYGFPESENELPRYEAEIDWRQTSEVDPDIVERVRTDRFTASGSGELYNTGKTTLDGSLSANQWRVDAWDAESKDLGGGLSIGMQRNELLKFSLGYTYLKQEYDTTGVTDDSDLTEHEVYVSARGALFSKVTGSVSFGITQTDVGGAVVYESTDWTAGADLDWEATARQRVSLGMLRGTWFSVSGDLISVTALHASLNQTIAGGFSVVLRGNFRDVNRRTSGLDDYQGLGIGVALKYSLTGKLTAELAAEYNDFDSDFAAYDYSRNVFHLGATYAF